MTDYRQDMQAYMEIASKYTSEQVEQAAIGMLIHLSNLASTANPYQIPGIQLQYSIAQALRLSALRRLGHSVGFEENLQLVNDNSVQAASRMSKAASDMTEAAGEVQSAADNLEDAKNDL